MATAWETSVILCPLYREQTRPMAIGCEGIDAHSRITLDFDSNLYRDRHKRDYCCSEYYDSCPVYDMVSANKYRP